MAVRRGRGRGRGRQHEQVRGSSAQPTTLLPGRVHCAVLLEALLLVLVLASTTY
jgi:hypothetical protein